MPFITHPSVSGKGKIHNLIVGVGLGLLCANVALATDSLYQNFSDVTYSIPASSYGPLPPPLDVTNFDNEGIFNIDLMVNSSKPRELYETSDTLNYTNGQNGVMTVNSPLAISLLGLTSLYSVGFNFDHYNSANGLETMSSSFYNQGTIRCNSVLDNNNGIFLYDGITYFSISSVGQCLVNATNIINPGDIDVSVNGGISLTGNNVDLSRGVFTIEPQSSVVFGIYGDILYNGVNFTGVGAVGTDTNGDWNPGVDLTATTAVSSQVPLPPYGLATILDLTNSTAYFDTPRVNGSNVIYRAVFVENNSQNVSYNVYFDSLNNNPALGFAQGAAHVEWVGPYTDPATGNSLTNYLYLTDDYVLGASTNAALNGVVPDNFSFETSDTPLLVGPVPAGFVNEFAAGAITNPYAYMNGNIVPTSVNTNQSGLGGISSLPSRIVIGGTNRLNLQNSIISGANFLSILATNQFDGSAGAQISVPYADLSLGVTNGTLSVTNLLAAQIPNWSGNIQAWSTRWLAVSTNGITNDYRVLLVFSQLQPITTPWVQNLTLLKATNMFISDVLNVYGNIYLDGQNLTVTTNGYSHGATSLQGTLMGYLAAPGNLGPAQWPHLRNVTNNGTIGGGDLVVFTNQFFSTNGMTVATNEYSAVINNGLITDQGTIIAATNFVNTGTITNGTGDFTVTAHTATLTNDFIYAGGTITLNSSNILATNTYLQSLSLVLDPSNSISDGGEIGNIWIVGRTNSSTGGNNSTGGKGFSLLNNPTNGDLLGTTITNIIPPANKEVIDTWAGIDRGPVNAGFSNNAALGHLVLNVAGPNSLVQFQGTGITNALYVDTIEFQGYLTNSANGGNNPSGIAFDFSKYLTFSNLTIYFAQAYVEGVSEAEDIEVASTTGGNGGGVTNGVITPGKLRWVPTYAGLFSSTNVGVGGTTNIINQALADSEDLGYLTPQSMHFSIAAPGAPANSASLTWNTVSGATNFVYYTTSLTNVWPRNWQLYTNFTVTNIYDTVFPVTIAEPISGSGVRFYKVLVQPWFTYPY